MTTKSPRRARTDVIDEWRSYLEQLDELAPKTIGNHLGAASRWWTYAGGQPFDPATATAERLEWFLDDLDGTDRHRAATVASVARFYRWALDVGHATHDPVSDLDPALARRAAGPYRSVQGLALHRWEAAMSRRGLALGTIQKRINLVRRWWAHCGGDPFGESVDWRAVERFIDDHDFATTNTRYATVSHLHRFYVWAQREGFAHHDPTILVERPRTRQNLPRPISDTDLALALTLAGPEMRAALMLFATSGLRCVELARLRWADVQPDHLRIHGKGDKQRVVPLHTAARDALDELERTAGHVFADWQCATATTPGARVSQNVARYLRSIGVDATAHQLRHWCGTTALRSTGDLRSVQELLGHASPATTAIYTKVDPSSLTHVVDSIQVPGGNPTPAAAPAAR